MKITFPKQKFWFSRMLCTTMVCNVHVANGEKNIKLYIFTTFKFIISTDVYRCLSACLYHGSDDQLTLLTVLWTFSAIIVATATATDFSLAAHYSANKHYNCTESSIVRCNVHLFLFFSLLYHRHQNSVPIHKCIEYEKVPKNFDAIMHLHVMQCVTVHTI